MQLTKDDVMKCKKLGIDITCLDYYKFQQVVKFYEKYRNNPDLLEKDDNVLFMIWYKPYCDYVQFKTSIKPPHFNDWLFNYCFKEGLK